MEDKEREFYQNLILRLFEYNSTLVMRIVGQGQFPPTPPISTFTVPFPLPDDATGGKPGDVFGSKMFKDMMDSMFRTRKEDDKLTE